MKVICWILIITMFICSGCGSTLWVDRESQSCTELNKKLKGKKATITLTDGQEMRGENIRATPDSTSWVELKSQRKQIIATSNVNKISVKNSGKGAHAGLWFGLLGGFTVVGLIGLLQSHKGGDAEIAGMYAFLASGPAGALLGLPIGAAVGVTDRYVIREPSEEKKEEEKEEDRRQGLKILMMSLGAGLFTLLIIEKVK